MSEEATPSLYERLGGVYNIAVVVDDLVDRVMVDPRSNANPRVDESHHRVSLAGFKYYVTEMLVRCSGLATGPVDGRFTPASHDHRGRVARIHRRRPARLNKFQVPNEESQEVVQIVESTRKRSWAPLSKAQP